MSAPAHRKTPLSAPVENERRKFYLRPTLLPPQWSAYVQSEGKVYFYHNGPIATVTESWIYTPNVAAEAEKWIDLLTWRIKERKIELADVELCIRIDEDKDCLYYVVDRRDRMLFWLEDYETADLGLDDVVSPAHLSKFVLPRTISSLLIDGRDCT